MSDRPYTFVDTAESLARAIPVLSPAKEMGVDAEMNGLHAFRARVCVMQIATDVGDLVVDTVAVHDLSALRATIETLGVVRYAHGAAHDVKCLKQDFGFGIGGLFDTYVAAQLLGVEKLGYGDIVQQRFGATLDKGLQTSDWGKRPLTPVQIEYLRGDIRYLIPLGRQLRQELVDKNLLEEAEYEFTRVAALPADVDELAEDAYLRPKESRELPPPGLSVLREVFLVRDAWARKLDRPPFKVVGEGALVEIARKRPATLEELMKIPGLPRHDRGSSHGNRQLISELLDAVARGVESGAPPPIRKPPAPRVEAEEVRARRLREEALRGWRKRHATARGVPPMAVLPSYTLDELVRSPARDAADLATRPGMIPKRMTLYAAELLALLLALPPALKSAPRSTLTHDSGDPLP